MVLKDRLRALDLLCALLSVGTPARRDNALAELAAQPALWDDVAACAQQNMMTPALHLELEAAGVHAPSEVAHLLTAMHALNMHRNARLRTQLMEAVAALNAVDIVPLVLKGGAQLLHAQGGEMGRLIMADLDILVPDPRTDDSVTALLELGYRALPEAAVDDKHTAAVLMRDNDVGSIDLHARFLDLDHILPVARVAADARVETVGDVRLAIPSLQDQVAYRLLHDQVQDRDHFAFQLNLRKLYQFARLAQDMDDGSAWAALHKDLGRHGLQRVLATHTWAAHRVFGIDVPAQVPIGRVTRARHAARWRQVATPESRLVTNFIGHVRFAFHRCQFSPDMSGPRLWLRQMSYGVPATVAYLAHLFRKYVLRTAES